MFAIRFDKSSIPELAASYPTDFDAEIETTMALQVRKRGYFLKPEFQALCSWKTPRSRPLVASNSDDYIEAVTRTALSTPSERLRIEVLTLLEGVSWPPASVVLHWMHAEPYPILDFRALWSLGIEDEIDYDFDFWWEYTQFCRALAIENNVSIRTLDRALWRYSDEYQGKR